MNPYQKKRRWKVFLLIFAIVIGGASVLYSNFFVKKMEREEAAQFQLESESVEQQMKMYDNERLTGVFETIKKNTTIGIDRLPPMIAPLLAGMA